ncbi:MAG: efflux transporter outer membrane subunit [Chlamydiales bacterium]|nr:efflux transporter outer membrane subunit [Chlamydiales bacterium]
MKGFKSLVLIALTGCAVGPNYQTPEVALPSSYHEPHDKEEIDLSELKEWWTTFNDPLLNVLIHEAISQNLDLKIAVEKIHQVRAEYQIEAAELYPKIDLTAEQRRTRISQNLFDSSFLGPPLQTLYKVGFDASWEIDIFGKRRRAKEGAYYSYEAEVNSARDVYITLLSEIAATYIQIRGLQQKIALSKRDIYIQKELLELAEVRFVAGLDSELSPQEVAVNLEESQALLPTLETSYRESLHRLAVLLGKTPESLHVDFEEQGTIPVSDTPIPIGLPSDLLRRRPDIRKAERILAAATANVGEAIADLFPRFSLIGSFGFESNQTNNWFKAKSRSWSLGPNIDWPIIYFGRIRANIRAQNAKQEQALLNYEQTILTSLEDVENRLVAYYKEEERVHRYEKQVEAARRSYVLTRDQYLSGLVDFSSLLDADSTLVFAENNLVESQQSLSTNRVALYKSLGGDW